MISDKTLRVVDYSLEGPNDRTRKQFTQSMGSGWPWLSASVGFLLSNSTAFGKARTNQAIHALTSVTPQTTSQAPNPTEITAGDRARLAADFSPIFYVRIVIFRPAPIFEARKFGGRIGDVI